MTVNNPQLIFSIKLHLLDISPQSWTFSPWMTFHLYVSPLWRFAPWNITTAGVIVHGGESFRGETTTTGERNVPNCQSGETYGTITIHKPKHRISLTRRKKCLSRYNVIFAIFVTSYNNNNNNNNVNRGNEYLSACIKCLFVRCGVRVNESYRHRKRYRISLTGIGYTIQDTGVPKTHRNIALVIFLC